MRFGQPEESDHAPVVAVEEDGELIAFLVSIVGRPADEAYRTGCRSVRAITSPVMLEGDGAGEDEVVFVEGTL